MGSGIRVVRIGVIVSALAVAGIGKAAASEIWVAPTYQADGGGLGIGSNAVWPVTPLGAVRLAWGVPGDLQTFTSARLVLIPHAAVAAGTVNVFVCAAEHGDMVGAACTGPHAQPFTGAANRLVEVDISAAIAPQVGVAGANHLALLAYTTPTILTDHIVGLRFIYDPAAPSGAATLGANTFSGTQTAPAFVGDGSGLTNVPLPAGTATLGANVFTGTQTAPAFVGDGSGLTNLPFPAGAATLGANTFTGTQTVDGANVDLDVSTSTAGNILKDGTRFLHTVGGVANLYLGTSAGNLGASNNSTENTGLGHMALRAQLFGHDNTAVGAHALSSDQGGAHNTAVGSGAMDSNTGGFHNTALGSGALNSNTFGTNNTSIGFATMLVNTTGDANTTLGLNGLASLSDGSLNTALGFQAGMDLQTGSNNVYLDNRGSASESDTTRLGDTQTRAFMAGVRGIAPANADALPVVIDSAGQLGTVSPTGIASLAANTFAGTQAIDGGNIDLEPSTATTGSLTKNGTRFLHDFGLGNTFLGLLAGNLTLTGEGNTGVGRNALQLNESGSHNTAVGAVSLAFNTSGTFNSAFGRDALRNSSTGDANTAVGFQALRDNVAGENNTATGADALEKATGTNNTAFGYAAGFSATNGSNNIYLGANVFGVAGESNTMYLGRVGTQTKSFIAGVRGITTANADAVPVVIDSAGQLGTVSPAGIATLGANTLTATQTIDTGNLDLDPSTDVAGNLTKNGIRFLHNFGVANTFLGGNAGNFTMTAAADGNTGVGAGALRSVTSGGGNSALGANALFFNTTGVSNTALGASALMVNSSGEGNTASGVNAMGANTDGHENTASGHSSLRLNTTGIGNTGVGVSALHSNLIGNSNTAMGRHALRNATGSNNAALGFSAGLNATTGSNNIYLGTNVVGEAGESNTMYLGRVGTQTKTVIAGVRGTTPANPDALPVVIDSAGQLGTVSPTGIATLAANTFATTQTIDGGNLDLDASTATAGNITKNGERFLHNFGTGNSFLGVNAGNLSMTGAGNTAVGVAALQNNAGGSSNTALGNGALAANTSGASNVAAGASALASNTSGNGNTAVGLNAMADNVDGFRGAALGSSALRHNTNGFSNTAAGVNALEFNTTGDQNTAVGDQALRNNTTGSRSVAVGWNAGLNATTGVNNIYLGADVVGVAGESNMMYLGNVGTQTKAFIAGVRGITTVNANAIPVLIDSAGQLGTISSSRRFKEDIQDMGDASARLLQLRPVTFRYTQPFAGGAKPIQYGLIAEEVAEVLPDLVVTGADGQVETVQYQKLDAMIINELQRLYRELQALKEEVAGLKSERLRAKAEGLR